MDELDLDLLATQLDDIVDDDDLLADLSQNYSCARCGAEEGDEELVLRLLDGYERYVHPHDCP